MYAYTTGNEFSWLCPRYDDITMRYEDRFANVDTWLGRVRVTLRYLTSDYIMRAHEYDSANVVMLCYSVNNRNSFNRVRHELIPEIKKSHSSVPLVIVACKTDLRRDENAAGFVSTNEGEREAERLGVRFVETSALDGIGVQEVFDTAVLAALKPRRRLFRRHGRCVLS